MLTTTTTNCGMDSSHTHVVTYIIPFVGFGCPDVILGTKGDDCDASGHRPFTSEGA